MSTHHHSNMTDELLTLDDIAALYKVNRRQARDAIVKAPGFPPIAPGTSPRKPRWPAVAVRRYIRQGPHDSRTPR
jgi:hypothetical protein